MKVRELIKVLETLDQEMPVRYWDVEYYDSDIDVIGFLPEEDEPHWYQPACYLLFSDESVITEYPTVRRIWEVRNEQKEK